MLAKWPATVRRCSLEPSANGPIGHTASDRSQNIRCREISEADLDAVAELLTRGFVGRSRDYWMQGLRRQAAREVPHGYPRFGYMLDNDGAPVGVLLLLYTLADATAARPRSSAICRAGMSNRRFATTRRC